MVKKEKKKNFTEGVVDRFKCEPGKQQSLYWDAKTPGLGVRVTQAGAKSYIFEAWVNKKSLRITIGDTRTYSIKKAQAEATHLKGLTDKGINPRKQEEEQVAAEAAIAEAKQIDAERRDILLSEVWGEYTKARRSKWGARHLADHEAVADAGGREVLRGEGVTSPGALAALMPLKLGQIDAEQVKAWLGNEASHRPTQAGLAFRLLAAFLRWCEDTPKYRGIASPDACSTRIAKDILPKRAAKRDCLQREQLRDWFAEVRRISNPTIAAYLQILLLTGPRREELAGLKWDDVDFKWNTLTIRDKDESKGGEDGFRTIPLTPYVASLLVGLKQRNDTPPPKHRILHGKKIENDLTNWKPSPWVFTSKTAATGRLTDPTRQHYEACAAAGIESLTLHGLRRSFGTLSEWCEVPAGIVAQIQGHKPSATAEKHYRVRPVDLLRMWHTKIEAWILEQAKIEFKQADKQEQPRLQEVA